MGWFDEQIRQRKQSDDAALSESIGQMAGAVLGKRAFDKLDNSRAAKNAIDEILKFYHLKTREVPQDFKTLEEQLEYLLRPHGVMFRKVKLSGEWYKDAAGPMLCYCKSDGKAKAVLPNGMKGHTCIDYESGRRVKVTKKVQNSFEQEALLFYQPFPPGKIGALGLLKYIAGTLRTSDIVLLALSALTVTLIGMFTPYLSHLLFSDVLASGKMRLLLSTGIFLLCTVISSLMFRSVRTLLTARIENKAHVTVQAAAMTRVLSLPTDFFKKYSAGDLAGRIQYMDEICSALVSSVLETGITALFSLIYIVQIRRYAPSLTLPAAVILALTLIISVIAAIVQSRVSRRETELEAKESGMSFSLISGVQKIKLAGAEKRAFARWGKLYAQRAELLYRPPLFLTLSGVLTAATALLGTVAIYYFSVTGHVAPAEYYAFYSVFGMVMGAFGGISDTAIKTAAVRPMLEMVRPILEEAPEISGSKEVLSRISGGVELSSVSFRYSENMPPVLEDLSLKIRPGQYVAIVGKSGCGKSTLMRLMLGFETPQKGAVYYDGKDLTSIDLRSLRSRIGVVMQDVRLFQGDIFSNIALCAPGLTLDEAWETAEKVGIADDIREMPMGMFTVVSEGGGGISGGQRQRLLIARAIARKPKILMLDEATSALDNITQKKVADTLGEMKCTRIVIAHRLSTIKQCDRIVVLDGGRIIEDGTYDELIGKKGFFAELVDKQQVK